MATVLGVTVSKYPIVYPISGNNCIGQKGDGSVWRKKKCLKGVDKYGYNYYTCCEWRYFLVSCSKINVQCNPLSGAYVAANTVCRQHLW
jgi:hypothetical protein